MKLEKSYKIGIHEIGLKVANAEQTKRNLESIKLHQFLSIQFREYFPFKRRQLDDDYVSVLANQLQNKLRTSSKICLSANSQKKLLLELIIDPNHKEKFVLRDEVQNNSILICDNSVVRITSISNTHQSEFVSELNARQIKKLRQFLQLMFRKASIQILPSSL